MKKTTSGLEFESNGNYKEYKVEAIYDRAVYAKKSKNHLLDLYYLVFWKDYPEEKNTWEPTLVI